MSAETKRNIELAAIILGPLFAAGIALMAVGGYQQRLAAAEANISVVSAAQKADHDVLTETHTLVVEMHDWMKAKSASPMLPK